MSSWLLVSRERFSVDSIEDGDDDAVVGQDPSGRGAVAKGYTAGRPGNHMSLATATLTTPFTTDEHGVIRVGASRVALERIVNAYDAGASPEEIVESYPTVELGDVYATITFILKNRSEVDAYMAESAADTERVHREWEARYPTSELRWRIRERALVANRQRSLVPVPATHGPGCFEAPLREF